MQIIQWCQLTHGIILGVVLFLFGCGGPPATPPRAVQPLAPRFNPPVATPTIITLPTSCVPEEYNQKESDGSTTHVWAMCDGTFRTEQIAPAPSAVHSCPQGCATANPPWPDCVIKGNRNFDTGEKIYHLPGWTYFGAAIIRPDYGERWFCTEAEARANGWRASFVK
jgi:hypothetical protein